MKKITDKQRLDWLSRQGQRTIRNVSPQRGDSCCRGWSYNGQDFILHAALGKGLRETIDKAITAKRKTK